MYGTSVVIIFILLRLSFSPTFVDRSNTCSKQWLCLASLPPQTRISSAIVFTPLKSLKAWVILFWKISGAELIPNGILRYWYCPNGVLNVDSSELFLSSLMCQNPEVASKTLNTLESLNSAAVSHFLKNARKEDHWREDEALPLTPV